MSLFGPANPRQLSLGLAIVRVVVGCIFVAHGYLKLGIMGLGAATGMFAQLGVPAPSITAPLVSVVEILGGIALILGLLTRLAALGLAIDMLCAILLVRIKGGFFNPNGAEFEILLFTACVAFVVAGAGVLSIDEAIATRRTAAAGDPYAGTR